MPSDAAPIFLQRNTKGRKREIRRNEHEDTKIRRPEHKLLANRYEGCLSMIAGCFPSLAVPVRFVSSRLRVHSFRPFALPCKNIAPHPPHGKAPGCWEA